jgi:hypothetical protein
MNLDDTIVAIATPPGRGGIGVVRIAGPQARSIAAPILRLRHELEPNRAIFGELIDPAGSCGAGAAARGSESREVSLLTEVADDPVLVAASAVSRAGAPAPHNQPACKI